MFHNKYRNKSGGLSLSAFRSVSKVVGRGVYCSSGTIFTHHSADMYLLCHFLAAKCSAIYGSIWFNSPGSNSYPSIGKMRLGALLFLMCLKLVQLCQTSCRSAAHMILNYRSLKHKYLANLRAPTTGTMLGPEESFFPFCQVICPAVK